MNRAIFMKWVCVSISCLLAFPSFADVGVAVAQERQELKAEIKREANADIKRSLQQRLVIQKEAINCGPDYMPLAELSDLAITCWEKKKSKESDPELSERELLDADRAVCACLGESTNVAIKARMLSASIKGTPQASEAAVKNFRDNVGLAQKRLQDLQNGMMFQASILSESNRAFTEAYSQGQMRKVLDPKQKQSGGRLAVDKIGEQVSSSWVKARGHNLFSATFMNDVRQSKATVNDGVANALNSLVLPPADKNLLTETKLAEGQCVSAREYLAYKQIPSPKSTFYSALTSKEYHPTDWNYNILQGQLKALETGSKDEVASRNSNIRQVRERMEFLNRNPMFKNFFMVSLATNDEYYKSANITDEEKAKIINNPGWTNLDAKKQELFNIIKGLNPSDKNNVAAFRQKATDFFIRPEVGYLTNLEVQKSMYREFENLKNPINLMPAKLPSTQKELEAKFAENTKYISPGECNKGGANVEKCVDSYSAYCKLLNDSEVQMYSNDTGAENLAADVTFENMDNFDPNISTNPDFKKFNDRICNSRRLARAPGANPSQTFFEFKKNYCSKNKNAACLASSVGGNDKIRDEYFKSYGELEQSPNKEDDRQIVENFDVTNKGMNTNKTMNLEEAEMVANSDSSPERSKNLLDRIGDFFTNKEEKKEEDAVVAVPVSEGSAFSTFAKGMGNLASNMGGQPMIEETSNFVPATAVVPTTTTVASEQRLSEDDKEKIRSQAEDEIAKSKKEIAAATSAAQKESLETRMKLMEELLAQKTENEAKYQKLIDQLSKKNDEKLDAKVAEAVKAETQSNRRQAANTFQASNNFDDFEDQRNRAPASVGDSGGYGTSGGTGGGNSSSSSSAGGAKVSAGSRGNKAVANFNTALLEAQEAKTGKIQKSSDGSIVVASDSDSPALKSLSNAASGTDYSLSVTAADYAGFENQSVETLKRYQEKLISSMDSNQSVRVLVKSDKKEPLEFYVVKDGGKLFFKPVRKSGATLEALKMAVKKTP